jgi:hypothetical protein
MELQTAIEILEYHQEWRLGKREDMIHEPKKLTEALDIVLSEVKKFRIGAVSGMLKCCSCGYEYEELIIAKDGNMRCKDCAF